MFHGRRGYQSSGNASLGLLNRARDIQEGNAGIGVLIKDT
jgi:hypothetical protein